MKHKYKHRSQAKIQSCAHLLLSNYLFLFIAEYSLTRVLMTFSVFLSMTSSGINTYEVTTVVLCLKQINGEHELDEQISLTSSGVKQKIGDTK